MNASNPKVVLKEMPAVISLPPLKVEGVGGRSLFEELVEGR